MVQNSSFVSGPLPKSQYFLFSFYTFGNQIVTVWQVPEQLQLCRQREYPFRGDYQHSLHSEISDLNCCFIWTADVQYVSQSFSC